MRATSLVIACVSVSVCAMGTSAHAQGVATRASAPLHDEPAAEISLAVLGGAATAPFVTMDFPLVDGGGAAVLVATRVRVRPRLAVGARVPLALVNVGQPAGSYVAEAAWGNPELFVERAYLPDVSRPLFVRARLAVGAPLAEYGSNGLMENRALAITDAVLAWRERELFIPGVVPITPAGEVTLPFRRWSAHAIVKMPVLVRVSDASGEGTTNAVGLTPVLGLEARAEITSRAHVTGGVHGAFELVRPLVWMDERSRVQTILHADFAWRITAGFGLGVSVLVPVGGPLGGETFAAGISLTYAR